MLNFNLLPPNQKELIERTKKVYLISGILKYIALLMIAFCVIAWSVNLTLSGLVRSQQESLENLKADPKIKETLLLDEEIKVLNANMRKIQGIQNSVQYFAVILEEITEMIPEGVYLGELGIERKTTAQTVPDPNQEGNLETNENQEKEDVQVDQNKQAVAFWEITISGNAQNRNQVILIEKRIDENEKFLNTTSDTQRNQNVLKPKDIDFNFTFQIKE